MVKSRPENRKHISNAIYRQLYVECRGRCCMCREEGIEEIHHIIPLSKGGSDAATNLAPVCASCHAEIHRDEENSRENVRAKKENWIESNKETLHAIITSGLSAEELIRRLGSFYMPKDPEQVTEFRKRLLHWASSPYLFNNFVDIRKHSIRKDVDDSGNCWTWEEQIFRPFSSLQRRTIQFSGTAPCDFETTRFTVTLVLGDKVIDPEWSCVTDDPNFKLVAVTLPRTIREGERCTMRCKYFWPSTWEMSGGVYTYDVLAWIEQIEYRFSVTPQWIIDSVHTAGLNVLGYGWESVGEVRWEGSCFEWKAKRLPLFTSCTLRHRTAHAM